MATLVEEERETVDAMIRRSLANSGENAFAELVRVLRRVAVAHGVSHEATEEAVQDALLALWQQRFGVVHPIAFAVTLFRRRVVDRFREERRRAARSLGSAPLEPLAVPSEAELSLWLRRAFHRLSGRGPELIRSKHVEGRSDAEIAVRLQLSAKSVPKLVSRAEKELRKRLAVGARPCFRRR